MDELFNTLSVLTNSPWYIGLIFGSAFFTYYMKEAVKIPGLYCSEGKFRNFLLNHVPVIQERYWPTLWCFESRLQTIMASVIRSRLLPHIQMKREILRLNDGGEVGLDWLEDNCSSDAPVIIILPGLTGASQAEYVKCLTLAANQIGIRIVVFNNRGLGGLILKTPRIYCAANSEDLEEVIKHVHSRNPNVKIGAIGISMGGLILGNYLASKQIATRKFLTAAMLISVPWNVFKGTESIEKPIFNLLLNKHLVRELFKILERLKQSFASGPWDYDQVKKSRTIREFDATFTVKQFGFKDIDDYYTQATMHEKLHLIKIPLLCLNAADDPFQPFDAVPLEAARISKFVAIMMTARGGHIGFLEGIWPLVRDQYISRVFAQYFGAVFRNEADILDITEQYH
uniref:AB hydrolase-1 domain-containing protein n=3 Tax=Timema TaxID=61471 RepID=A0A7R9INH6_9NEOP|nr:unnamed protein product [Timema tahoe]